jgi:hypothetical protein
MPRNLDLYRNRAQVQNNPTNTLGSSTAAAIAAQKPPDLLQLVVDALESLVNEILQGIDNLTGLDLVGFAKQLESLFGNIGNGGLLNTLLQVIKDILGLLGNPGNIGTGHPLLATLESIPIFGPLLQLLVGIVNAITGGIGTVIGGAETLAGDIIGTLEGWATDLEKLLGLGGSTSGNGSTGTTIAGNTTPLQQLLGLLGTDKAVPPSLFSALAPAASKNVLNDATFDGSGGILGQGLWCWDGWLGTGAFSGVNSSIRTVRPGVITIYNIIGTTQGIFLFGGEPINTGGNGQVLEYLRDAQYSFLVDWVLTGVNPAYFEWINVPYPAAEYPMGPSVQAGATWLINQINQTPGPFIFVCDSQGNNVGGAVYDEIRFGKLQNRRNDFLAAVGLGNPRREKGHTFPGYPDPAPGTSGMCPIALMTTGPYAGGNNPANPKIGNLIDTEDLWWDFCVAGDYYACTPINGSTVDPGPTALGGNNGDIAGVPGYSFRQFYAFINQAYGGGNNIITDVINWTLSNGFSGDIAILQEFMGAVYAQIGALGSINSPHNSYFTAKPFAAKGDNRTFTEIGIDYINSFIGGAHPDGTPIPAPPVNGTRHQFLSARVAVGAEQVITAGASTMWVNVDCIGPAIIVGVNAYDSGPNDPNANLIATVTAAQCVISDPEPSSNWTWVPLQADFVMPVGTQSACLVLNVEPQAMSAGIVWFDSCLFEPTTLFDGAWVDTAGLSPLAGTQVMGPQGQADYWTAEQNMLDSLASAHSQTSITGATLLQMLQAVGQTAQQAQLGYRLGVANNQILGNAAVAPFWAGNNVSGQCTYPLPAGTLSTTTLTAGSTLMGFINTNPALTPGFVEIIAHGSSPTGVYLNAYSVDPTTGNMTNVWSSADISSSLSTGGTSVWLGTNIPTASQPTFALGQWALWEIVAQGSTITVVSNTVGAPNKPYMIPPNVGAARTTASTGGVSPSSLTPSQISYGGTAPFVCMSLTALPPSYMPPNQTAFTTAGIYTYTIPTWVLAGDFIDLVPVGAGGAAGWADGQYYAGPLGHVWINTIADGQGGAAGEWNKATLTYGTDIPGTTTALTAIIGSGGQAPGGSGGDTILGYGALATPTFDAAGAGGNIYGTTLTWNHTATAGAYVLVGIATSFGTFNVKYGTATMIPLGLIYNNNTASNGATALYGLPNAPGGASTVTVTFGTAAYASGNSLSFTNVSCAGAVINTYGTGTALSQNVACSASQLIVQVFGNAGYGQLESFTGGTHRSYTYVPAGAYYSQGLSMSYATTATTFGAATGVPDYWGALAVVLNPAIANVLLTAEGGAAGGPGGASNFNPANTNTGSNGLSPGNNTWAGRTYIGGSETAALAYPGNPPGGGASGGNQAISPVGPNFAGADGGLWITARRGSSSITGAGGIGGGGSELAVVYEATGTGGQNTSSSSLTWTHTSGGGPSCAVVLIGSVDYSGGAASIACTYGATSFIYNLDELTYYNSGGVALGIFAFGVIGPPSGTQTITLSATGATIGNLAGNTVSYQNVGAFGNFYTNSGSGTALSLSSIPAATNEYVIGGFAGLNHVLGSYNKTSRWNQTNTASIPMVIGDAVGASTVSFTATQTSDGWGAVGGVLLPSS